MIFVDEYNERGDLISQYYVKLIIST